MPAYDHCKHCDDDCTDLGDSYVHTVPCVLCNFGKANDATRQIPASTGTTE